MKQFLLLGLAMVMAALGFFLQASGGEQAPYALPAFLTGAVFFCAQIIMVSTRRGVMLTALLAGGSNAYLLYKKFSGGSSICDISAVLDCGTLNSSAASELFGIPVTVFGVGFYLGLAFASLGDSKRSPRFDQVNALFAIISLLFSAYLGWEAKKLGVVCVFCLTIYAANFLLLWAGLKGLRETNRSLIDGIDKIFGTSSLWVITATFALVVLVGSSAWRTHVSDSPSAKLQSKESRSKLSVQEYAALYQRPKGEITTDGSEPLLGKRDARITIVEFADYACPHCAHAAPLMKELIHDHPDAKLYFKAFPLSGACNPVLEPTEDGVGRCKAAMAAECAGQQNRYYDMSSMLFKNLGYNSDGDLTFMATELELDMDRWNACMTSPGAIDAVIEDARAGGLAGVMGTPSIFVKGIVGDEWIEIPQGPKALRALIEGKKAGVQFLPAQ